MLQAAKALIQVQYIDVKDDPEYVAGVPGALL